MLQVKVGCWHDHDHFLPSIPGTLTNSVNGTPIWRAHWSNRIAVANPVIAVKNARKCATLNPLTFSLYLFSPVFFGRQYPGVGMLSTVAPAAIQLTNTGKKPLSVRPAFSIKFYIFNNDLAWRTAATARSMICSRVALNLYWMENRGVHPHTRAFGKLSASAAVSIFS